MTPVMALFIDDLRKAARDNAAVASVLQLVAKHGIKGAGLSQQEAEMRDCIVVANAFAELDRQSGEESSDA